MPYIILVIVLWCKINMILLKKKREISNVSNVTWWISQRFDNGTRDASFSIGLQGIKKDDYAMVVEQIHKTFDQVIE